MNKKSKIKFSDLILEELEESSSSLKQVAINKYGWKEKSNQLDNGGELGSGIVNIVNELIEEFSKTNPNCKGTFTSGNDKFHKSIKSYVSRHTKGEAIDLVLPSSCHSSFIDLLNKYRQKYYGFNYIDEYRNPTKLATGGHFHLSYRPGHPEGGKKSGKITDIPKGTSTPSEGNITDFLSALFGKSSSQSTPPTSNSLFSPQFLSSMLKLAFGAKVNESKLNENFNINSFGGSAIIRGKKIIIPSQTNLKIYSPDSGVIQNIPQITSCNNNITLKSRQNGEDYYIQFCGISSPNVNVGRIVSVGELLGTTDTDVNIYIYNSNLQKIDLNTITNTQNVSTTQNSKSDQSTKTSSSILPLIFSKKEKRKSVDKIKSDDYIQPPKKGYNHKHPMWWALSKVSEPFTSGWTSATSGKHPKPFWTSATSGKNPSWVNENEEKLNEDIKRMKKLL